MRKAVVAPRLFTGESFLDDHAVLIENGRVLDLRPVSSLPAGVSVERLPADALVAPGFIDVQVNGGGGVLFNDVPTLSGLRAVADAHRRFGTTALLPTFITDAPEGMRAAVHAARDAIEARIPGIVGLHLEGPFISPERKGIHRADFIREPEEADVALLCEPFPGPLLVTLAPERVSRAVAQRLKAAGVILSIGHSAATYDEAEAALWDGATGFTHLFNAMSQLGSREPGVVGAALGHEKSFAGIIVDGHHVHPAALRTAFATKGPNRLMLVTDAMSSLGAQSDSFLLQGRRIYVADGRLTDENGTLAGAHLDMASAVRNAIEMMQATLADALRMASTTPAAFLGLEHTHGKLLPGFRADAVALDSRFGAIATWIGGERK